MKNVLLATMKPFVSVAVQGIRQILSEAGYNVILLDKYSDQQDLVKAAQDADAMIIRSDIADRAVIQAAKKLKIIVRAGAGYDNIDLKTATEKGIVAMNTPGQNANAVAELAFGMMLYLARVQFSGKSGSELRGKTLGLHAFGNVSRCMAEIAKGFGMKLAAFDPFIPAKEIEKAGVKAVSTVDELFAGNQYISLHIPLTDQTRKSIDFDLLSKMPKEATLVNTARKEIVDEDGLIRMFTERPDFKYISDIIPDCKDAINEKFSGRFCFSAKKAGAQTEEANINAGLAAARQIVNFFEKGDVTYQVNK
jgi:D-3-phosphoglycerate dehydrogenase